MPQYNPQLTERARELRRNMTQQERRLWYCFLKNHQLKFYRQRPIGWYIADFYCKKAKLVIEIDGQQHKISENVEYDNARTKYMNSLGLSVIRFNNYEIDNDFDSVCSKIQDKIISSVFNPTASLRSAPPLT